MLAEKPEQQSFSEYRPAYARWNIRKTISEVVFRVRPGTAWKAVGTGAMNWFVIHKWKLQCSSTACKTLV